MSQDRPSLAKKRVYFEKIDGLLKEYSSLLIVHADNVSSRQMQDIRISLRGRAVLLFGKNTMMRRAINATGGDWLKLLPKVVGNIGFLFSHEDLGSMRDVVNENRVGAPARAGAIAPCAVTIPAQNTGLDPSQTAVFQSCNIPTKIAKGTIEITNDVEVIQPGDKVGQTEAMLLQKLGIRPFTYGLEIVGCFADGGLFDVAVLDMTDEMLINIFMAGVGNVTRVSLAANFPTKLSVPHSFLKSYQNVLAVALMTDYKFFESEKICEALKEA